MTIGEATESAVVISDLHVGAGQTDDCDEELEGLTASFINRIGSRGRRELIIAGDFLDFAQAPPWKGAELEGISEEGVRLCFTEPQSLQKLDAIAARHPRIFEALGAFIATDASNLLTILPGNHDADFFWPQIRSRFAELIGATSGARERQLQFHLQEYYRPPCLPKVWIEHGHQHDPINSFYVNGQPRWSEETPPIFNDLSGEPRLYECVGTRFLVRFLNDIDVLYPFVDNVKPFSRVFELYLKSALVPGFGPLRAAVAAWAMVKFLARTAGTAPSDLLSNGPSVPPPEEWLAAHVSSMGKSTQQAFIACLAKHGFRVDRPISMLVKDRERAEKLLDFLADKPEVLNILPLDDPSALGLDSTEGMLSLSSGFLKDESTLLRGAAQRILSLQDGVSTVLMGHTHERIFELPKYVNMGSWTRYHVDTTSSRLHSWETLRTKNYEHFPFELSAIELDPALLNPIRVLPYHIGDVT